MSMPETNISLHTASNYSQKLLRPIGSIEHSVVRIRHLLRPEAARVFPLSPKNHCLPLYHPSQDTAIDICHAIISSLG